MKQPKVSVVIPVRNRPELIREAVESALTQVDVSVEVIVVDDASTDSTPSVLASFGDRIRILTLRTRAGRSGARNAGISEARGSTLAFLDSDDRWSPDKLSRQLALMEERGPALVTGYVRAIDDEGKERSSDTELMRRRLKLTAQSQFDLESLISRPAVYTSTFLIPNDILQQVGTFDGRTDGLEDWDFMLRARKWVPIVAVDWPPIVDYRLHAGNTQDERMALAAQATAYKQISDPELPSSARAALLLIVARSFRTMARQREAFRTCVKTVTEWPAVLLRASWWRLAIGALIPRSVALMLRGARD